MASKIGFRFYARLLSLVVMIFGFTASVCAQYGAYVSRYIFKGTIKDSISLKVVPNTKVTLINYDKPNERRVTLTDSNGEFKFKDDIYYDDKIRLIFSDSLPDKNHLSLVLKDTTFVINRNIKGNVTDHNGYHFLYEFNRDFLINRKNEEIVVHSPTGENKDTSSPSISVVMAENQIIETKTSADTHTNKSDEKYILQTTDSFNQSSSAISEIKHLKIQQNQPEVSIFPNPSDGKYSFKIKNPLSGKLNISFFDIQGKLLTTMLLENVKDQISYPIDLANYPSSSYLVRFNSGGWTQTLTILKN